MSGGWPSNAKTRRKTPRRCIEMIWYIVGGVVLVALLVGGLAGLVDPGAAPACNCPRRLLYVLNVGALGLPQYETEHTDACRRGER